MKRRPLLTAFACGAALPWAAFANDAPYPGKPIRLIVGYAPGAQSDAIARLTAQKLGEILGASIVVDNRPGANGTIGVETGARAAPDGYTLLLAGGGTLAVAPALDSAVRYDAERDFAPIARIARVPQILAARANLPFENVAGLLGYARANPGKLTYASSGATTQLALESLKAAASVDILHVPYKGTAPAVLEVVAGRVDLVLADTVALAPHVRSGALHVIANAGATRARAFTDVPTMVEQGLPDFVWESWQALVAPAATPRAIVAQLQFALRQAKSAPELRESLERLGFEPIDEAPEAFAPLLHAEIERYKALVKRLALRIAP